MPTTALAHSICGLSINEKPRDIAQGFVVGTVLLTVRRRREQQRHFSSCFRADATTRENRHSPTPSGSANCVSARPNLIGSVVRRFCPDYEPAAAPIRRKLAESPLSVRLLNPKKRIETRNLPTPSIDDCSPVHPWSAAEADRERGGRLWWGRAEK
jgi:hypothetical protein